MQSPGNPIHLAGVAGMAFSFLTFALEGERRDKRKGRHHYNKMAALVNAYLLIKMGELYHNTGRSVRQNLLHFI